MPEKLSAEMGPTDLDRVKMTQSEASETLPWVREKAPRDVSDPTGMIYDHWEVGRVNISLREPEKCPKKDKKLKKNYF